MSTKLKIEGVADFSSIEKAVKDLGTVIPQAFGKDGLKIFDDKQLVFLKKETQDTFGKAQKALGKVRQEAAQLQTQLAAVTGQEEEQQKISAKIVQNLRETVRLEKSLADLKGHQSHIETGQAPTAQAKALKESAKKAAREQKDALKAMSAEDRKSEKARIASESAQIKASAKLKAEEDQKTAKEQKAAEAAEKAAAKASAVEKKKQAQEQDKLNKAAMKSMSSAEKKDFKEKIALEKKREKEKVLELKKFSADAKQLAKKNSDEEKKASNVLNLSQKLAQKKQNDDARSKDREEAEDDKKKNSFKRFATNTINTGAANVGDQLPAVSQAMQVGGKAAEAGKAASSAGMSLPVIAGFTTVAAAAALAAVAITRMVSGFEVFKAGIPNLLAITGMEATPVSRDKGAMGAGAAMGYDVHDMLETQKQMEQALGNTKRGSDGTLQKLSPKEDNNRLLNVMTASRDLGMQPQEIVSGGEQLRKQGGTDVANKQLAMILEKATASGMDKSQASHFLSSAVGLLSEINQSGTANTAEMLGVLSDLHKSGMSPEQAAKTLSGMNSAIAGSSGESNSFFQGAAAKAGIGGGSILGTKLAVSQGMTGVNMGDLQSQVGGSATGRMGIKAVKEMGLDDAAFGQKFASSILGELKTRFGGMDTKEKRQGAMGFTNSTFGTKTAAEAAKVWHVLDKMAQGQKLGKEDQKFYNGLGQDPEASWRENTLSKLDATALSTASIDASLKNGQFELGATSSEYINKLNQALTTLDGTLNEFLQSSDFKDLLTGLQSAGKAIGEVLSPIFDGIISDFAKLPDALSGLFDDIMEDPFEFGKTMGKGFVDLFMPMWDAMLTALQEITKKWEDILKHPQEFVDDAKETAGDVLDFVGDQLKLLTKLVEGGLAGAAEGQVEHADTGSVGYTAAQSRTLGNVKAVGTAAADLTAPGLAVRVGQELYNNLADSGMASPVKSGPNANPGSAFGPPAPPQETPAELGEIVTELKKANKLHEKNSRPAGTPNTRRDATKP